MKQLSAQNSLLRLTFVVFVAIAFCHTARCASAPAIAPIPTEVASTHFRVQINGQQSAVVHAAVGYYLLNFTVAGSTDITVTADDPHFWDRGVEVQPMRFGIRPRRDGASIHFTLNAPAKLSIARPGDHSGTSEMLFLFANKPETETVTANTPGIRYFGPGVHRENIDAHTGDNIYLADGAVVFGALNVWRVHHVHVFGRGMLLYDGPQNPNDDTGWMHKRNWHVIVMDNAHDITIEGITAVVRSRTWMIQMRDSRGLVFRNVKVIGGSPGNANQDGMDWLGGGDTLVQDCFFRTADDIFAIYGNWDGYTEKALTTPGHDVSNITIEDSTLSTSISNVFRANWPKKIFNSRHITLRNSDVMHMGQGSCGIPFALLEIWADPAGKGDQSDYRFENIRLEDWYSLTQLQQPNPRVHNITFDGVWVLDGPGLAASSLKGDVSGVTFKDVDLGNGNLRLPEGLPVVISGGAAAPQFQSSLAASFAYPSGLIQPGQPVTFTAEPVADAQYHWIFGDGSSADGATVQHAFPDAEGTLLDGSGRFRVLLHVTGSNGRQAWASRSIAVAGHLLPAQTALPASGPAGRSVQSSITAPVDGGYTFDLLTSTTAALTVDGVTVRSRPLEAQVCGSPGAAVQDLRVSVALAAGPHRLEIQRGPESENAQAPGGTGTGPVLLWEGPGHRRQVLDLR